MTPSGRQAARGLAAACAAVGIWLTQQILSGDAVLAYAILGLQRRTFGSALRYAIANELWEDALGIFTPLDFFCDARGMTQEADTWGDLVGLATEDLSGNPPRLGTPAGVLWALAAIRQANRQRARHHLDEAERLYNRIRSLAEAQVPSGDQQGCLADVYHQLGRIAQDRGQRCRRGLVPPVTCGQEKNGWWRSYRQHLPSDRHGRSGPGPIRPRRILAP